MTVSTTTSRGFTLVELAISIFIIALLLGSILVPLTTQVEQRQISETQKTMDDIRDALIGFAVANGRLPCPDVQTVTPGATPNDGIEDVVANRCPNLVSVGANNIVSGNLPWSTLGMASQDLWGNRFRYAVVENFARSDTLFTFATTAVLRVCPTAATCLAAPLTSTAVAVIISHGNNGQGAINATTNAVNLPLPTAADELENTNNNRDAVSRVKSNVAATEFDDVVVWLPRFTLLNRMVAAGKLP